MIPALAFLPLEEVEPAFDLLVEEITGEVELLSLEEDVLEKINLLASYFQKTYLGHNIGSTHRPVFQPVIWNQSVSAIDGLERTNNATKGWHFGLQALFQGSHPDIWTFLPQLKKDSFVHKFNAIQGLGGGGGVPRTPPEKSTVCLTTECKISVGSTKLEKKCTSWELSLICSEERYYENNENFFACNLIFEF